MRLERDFTADLAAAWPGITNVTVTGWHLWSPVGATIGMDGLHFGNALTVQHNVLGGGAVGYILVTQNITPATGSESRIWHHYDQVGSVMMTSHAGGGPASQRLADAFGNTISSHFTGTWIDSWSASGHNTKEYDLEADLVYMYQRWYDPKSGTFASMAPYPPMREHEYGFAENGPGSKVDPSGEWWAIQPPAIAYMFWGCPFAFGDAISDAYDSALRTGQVTDKFVHCVVSCIIAQECGKLPALNAGWMQEREYWFDYDYRDTNEDLEANATGMNIAEQLNNGSCSFGPDCESGCEKAGY